MHMTQNKQSRLRRFLRRARDFYVDSLVSFDSKVGSANIVSGPTGNAPHLPKSFGLKDDDQHLEEMYRSICSKYNWSGMEVDRGGCLRERGRGYGGMERSYSIALGKIGTIDEDEPCEFQEDVVRNDFFLRSRSHAVVRSYGLH